MGVSQRTISRVLTEYERSVTQEQSKASAACRSRSKSKKKDVKSYGKVTED